ncbi:MAG: peptide deformylase [Clostridia bacterium]
MAIRNIVKKGDEVLGKKCKDVTVFDEKLHTLLDDMVETMFEANGVGLAAPQIGMLRRIAVVLNIDTEEVFEIINPEIVEQSGEESGIEGCLSVPGIYGYVARPTYVKVKYQDRNGEHKEIEANDFFARAFCHEIDHLYGHLFDDLVTEFIDPSELEV